MTRKRKGHDEEGSAWHHIVIVWYHIVIAGLTGNLVTGNLEMPDRGRA